MWHALKKEITENYFILQRWNQIITAEGVLLKDNRYNLVFLELYNVNFLDDIKYHLPKKLRNDTSLLDAVMNLKGVFSELNTQGYGKNQHQVISMTLDQTPANIQDYNKYIKLLIEEAIQIINSNNDELIFNDIESYKTKHPIVTKYLGQAKKDIKE